MEPRLRQHPREHVEAGMDLLSVALAVFASEGPRCNLLTHAHSIRAWLKIGKRRRWPRCPIACRA
jgi:hypothetical protein